ncbi:sll0787 family AIR synthase-like protein [Robbsia sp. Bb-Pol-6]|uniref:Sll0787 family AIR synthase-like protein n=1 Tax=Robbsia betulipollinis TaxID=2981849 RepID=A0ABT3ZUX6_9BURK|nr:sll0787 family AIR synthase-like protein [Robbsia betulipollinis]MCY0389643.1 sll0787 family AIR synthase-like protein [Robbsia betulipollinis]
MPAPAFTDAATLAALARQVREARGVAHKRDIAAVVDRLGAGGGYLPGATGDVAGSDGPGHDGAIAPAVPLGDDCAAWADGDGFLLFAIEGFVDAFVAAEPRFAGYCGVMVNVSDIYAMGGRPIAVVDALWSRPGDAAAPILDGLAQAARVYGVPIVGGHSNRRCDREQLSVAILGRATRLLSSFAARPGEHLVAVIDLRGGFHEPFPYWDASSGAPAARLRADLDILPQLAEAGLCRAAKDISMAGIVGTALMFAECSGVGLTIDVDAIPRPPTVPLARWIDLFPSYGFLLAVDDAALPAVLAAFAQRELAAAAIGRFDASRAVRLRAGGAAVATGTAAVAAAAAAAAAVSHAQDADQATVWDFTQDALIGCGPRAGGR